MSHRCKDLILSLLREKENRLCSQRYRLNDPLPKQTATKETNAFQTSLRYVYPKDGEDIKAHRFFRGVEWNRLDEVPPPFIPQIKTEDDTRYFDDEDEISDWSASGEYESDPEAERLVTCPTAHPEQQQQPDFEGPETNDQAVGNAPAVKVSHVHILPNPEVNEHQISAQSQVGVLGINPQGQQALDQNQDAPQYLPSAGAAKPLILCPLGSHPQRQAGEETKQHPAIRKATPNQKASALAALLALPRELQPLAQNYIATPFDGARLRRIEREIELLPQTSPNEQEALLQFVRLFGKRERRRPRDRLLRDRRTRDTVMKVRKRDGFLGYTWCRRRRNGRLGVDDFGRGRASLGLYIDGARDAAQFVGCNSPRSVLSSRTMNRETAVRAEIFLDFEARIGPG